MPGRVWTREKLIEKIQELAKGGVDLSPTAIQKTHSALFSSARSRSHFGNWRDAGAKLQIRGRAMCNFRFSLLQDLQFVFVQPNAMRQHNVWCGQSDRVQITYISQTRALFDQGDFIAVFRGMRVNQHAVFTRKLCDLFQ